MAVALRVPGECAGSAPSTGSHAPPMSIVSRLPLWPTRNCSFFIGCCQILTLGLFSSLRADTGTAACRAGLEIQRLTRPLNGNARYTNCTQSADKLRLCFPISKIHEAMVHETNCALPSALSISVFLERNLLQCSHLALAPDMRTTRAPHRLPGVSTSLARLGPSSAASSFLSSGASDALSSASFSACTLPGASCRI